MKFHLPARVALAAALWLCPFLVQAHAQNSGSIRSVRLSLTDGQVFVSHPGNNRWDDAPFNLALQEGDTLATEGGLAEIEFENGATAYLAEDSVLEFTQLGFSGGGRVTDLTLHQGAGTFYANLTSQDLFRVRTFTCDVAIPERAEFRVDAFKGGAAIQVLLGNVSVGTNAGSTELEKGQSVAIHDKDVRHLQVARLLNPDGFDDWVTSRQSGIETVAPQTWSGSEAIVFDVLTRTYINGNGGGHVRDGRYRRDGNEPGNRDNVPATPAALASRPNSGPQTEIPRVILPPSGPTDSRVNRVLLPPPYPTAPASRGNVPTNGAASARPPIVPPPNTQQRSITPPLSSRPYSAAPNLPAQTPRPVAQPPASSSQPPSRYGGAPQQTSPPQRH